MGQMKKLARELATMVYVRRWKDKDIIETLKGRGMNTQWIQDQIAIVRKNPQIYKDMTGARD